MQYYILVKKKSYKVFLNKNKDVKSQWAAIAFLYIILFFQDHMDLHLSETVLPLSFLLATLILILEDYAHKEITVTSLNTLSKNKPSSQTANSISIAE